MIKNSPKAIKFYIKSAWARGKPTGEIIKKYMIRLVRRMK